MDREYRKATLRFEDVFSPFLFALRFGSGPHQVEFTVATPYLGDDASAEQKAKQRIATFTVQLAPLNMMPHATHLFLEQVSHGLWDKSVFSVNQPHVLQVGPKNRQIFADYELDKLAFPEYSEHFPHKKWTLGFAGRPGGPSWYINKLDNSEDHGPYGQDHHALHEYADPCFAKVVGGFDSLQHVFDTPEPTEIVSVKVIDWQDHWTEEDSESWHKAHEKWESGDDYYSGSSSREASESGDGSGHGHEHHSHLVHADGHQHHHHVDHHHHTNAHPHQHHHENLSHDQAPAHSTGSHVGSLESYYAMQRQQRNGH